MTTIRQTRLRRLVLCLDGTWNSAYDEQQRDDGSSVLKPTNVLKTARAVVPMSADGTVEQVVYYDIGVGSLGTYPGLSNQLLHSADRFLGGAWGAGFEGNIEDALAFVANNYGDGDELFVFGFSRGAATARALTRFIEWAGGLPAREDNYYLPKLFRAFVIGRGARSCADVVSEINDKRASENTELQPLEPFREIKIKFLGVWDTVMALGARFEATAASTSSQARSFFVDECVSSCVLHARHALAIDKRRFDFRPEIWQRCADHQSLQQRWFAGVHSNVGGGYVHDGLANIAFQWVVEEAKSFGLVVNRDYMKHYRGYPQDRMYVTYTRDYWFGDFIRGRLQQGIRRLDGHPTSANLSIDPSVFTRFRSDPASRGKDDELEFPRLVTAYRPQNVVDFLKTTHPANGNSGGNANSH